MEGALVTAHGTPRQCPTPASRGARTPAPPFSQMRERPNFLLDGPFAERLYYHQSFVSSSRKHAWMAIFF
jgi:hypothetical protein